MIVPTLDAYSHGDSLLAWCPHCSVWHVHGLDPADPGGDVAAHCGCAQSPFALTGYVLRYVGPLADAPREVRDRQPARDHRCDRRTRGR